MKLVTVGTLISVLASFACGGESEPAPDPKGVKFVDEQLKKDLGRIKEGKILFAHHSVGDNLLQGLKELASEAGIDVKVTELRPGENGNPKKKVDDFVARVLTEPKDTGAELVALKFCYADFSPQTNAQELLGYYKDGIAKIRAARPDLTILHLTAPMTTFRGGVKNKIKRMLGREVWEDEATKRRFEYNEGLKAAMKDELLFDLAAVEAKRPSGTIEQAELGGKMYPALYAGYTMDGGHLNELGRKVGAKAFAHALAAALEKRPKIAEQPEERRVD